MPNMVRESGLRFDAGDGGPGPRVTVLALCFNHARYVTECLDSIDSQHYQGFQLIVTDDASSDDSPRQIEEWLRAKRPDAIFLRHSENKGICRTLNEALGHARGAYISLISTDDAWEPDKLSRQLEHLERQPSDVAMVYSDASLMDVDGNALSGNFIDRHAPGLEPPSGDLLDALATRNFIPAMSTLVRRESLIAVGGYDERLAFEDYDMWLRVAARFRIHHVAGALARYRIVPGSLGDKLFSVPGEAALEADCFIASKLLRERRLSKPLTARWRKRFAHVAEELYQRKAPCAPRWLRAAAVQSPGRRQTLLAIAATVGLPFSSLSRIRARLP